jgi:hypothetical protein
MLYDFTRVGQRIMFLRSAIRHIFVSVVRKTQLRRFSKFAGTLCAISQFRIFPLQAFMDVTFCHTRSGATKGPCFMERGVFQKWFRGKRRYMPYTLYSLSLFFYSPPPPPPPLKIANQHPWPCQPRKERECALKKIRMEFMAINVITYNVIARERGGGERMSKIGNEL